MIDDLLKSISTIYIVYGATDFRKQIYSLCELVKSKFKLNPYKKEAFIFCNKKRTSIKVLCYDKNGFILAQKTLLDTNKMKFQWPRRNSSELKKITKEQLNWLLSGLKIYPDKYFKEIEIDEEKIAITEFLNDGRIPISNNLVETSIRPLAIHRKNWLFADTIAGAKANATMYTIIETAKINKLNISKYINYLLEELPQLEDINDEKELAKYLPWSEELPEEIRNYEGEYKELMVN